MRARALALPALLATALAFAALPAEAAGVHACAAGVCASAAAGAALRGSTVFVYGCTSATGCVLLQSVNTGVHPPVGVPSVCVAAPGGLPAWVGACVP